MKRVAILQSNYIPWKGYFDLIAAVDEFIFYDDVQYTKGDWRNRNRIKTPHGAQWLTIPVGDSLARRIRDVGIVDPDCGRAHWKRLASNYARAEHFDDVASWLAPHYVEAEWTQLVAVNHRLVRAICERLGIATELRASWDYVLDGDRNERLVSLCRQAGAATYVSGPSARDYLDVAAFERAGVAVRWFDYTGYPEYPQLWGPFVHDVSIVDLLFNCGPEAPRFMRHASR